jgi:anoctamin-1
MNNDRCHGNLRSLLRQEWTALNKLHRYQPLDYIKDYFGVKIALYFAWLGFYTHTLLFASVVGCLCFFYSVLSLPAHIPSREICSGTFNVTMCPICDHSGEHSCGYWYLGETCLHSKAAYLFDNSTTVFFAVFMSLWAALFLEMWKRYSAEITHRWDLTGFDHQEEHPRPQYFARLAHITTKRVRRIVSYANLIVFTKLVS